MREFFFLFQQFFCSLLVEAKDQVHLCSATIAT